MKKLRFFLLISTEKMLIFQNSQYKTENITNQNKL